MIKQALKSALLILLVGLLCTALLPLQAWAVEQTNIRLEGSRSVPVQDYVIAEEFTVTYCVKPAGTLVARDAIQVALVMDVSGSMAFHVSEDDTRTRMTVAKESAKIITKNFRRANLQDQIGLVTFESHPHMLSGLTANYDVIDDYIDRRLQPNGGTNIQMGLDYGYRVVQHSPADTRSIILLTDGAASAYYMSFFGNDIVVNDSRGTTAKRYAKDKADEIARQGVPVYTIALATAGTDEVDLDLLDYISSETGGQSFTATNPEELDAAFERILDLIEPSFRDVVLHQPLPKGLQLAEGETRATLKNGVLSMELGNIPFSEESDEGCAYPVKLTYTGEPGTITLPQATVDYMLDDQARQAIIDDEIVLRFHDVLSLQGSVMPREPISAEQAAKWDKSQSIDVTYTLKPTGLIQNNKFNVLKRVRIVHTLPEGVVVSEEGLAANVNVTDGGRTVTIHIGDITLDEELRITEQMTLQLQHAGLFDLQRADATVEFTNNAGRTERVTLENGLPALHAYVLLRDQWENEYWGDGEGKVTRWSRTGHMQWHVDLSEQPVSEMRFRNGSEQAIVDVAFYQSESEQSLNLLPTIPEVTIKDFYGDEIADGDTAYRRGHGKLSAIGSRSSLPAHTVYVDDSFRADYISSYQMQINGGPWQDFLPSAIRSIAENGENIDIRVRATTRSIGDGATRHYGPEQQRSVSLDGIPPIVPLIEDRHIQIEGDHYQYSIPNDFSDAHSGIRTDADGDEVFIVFVGGEGSETRKINAAGLKLNVPIDKVRNGLAVLEVEDKVGNLKSYALPEISDTQKPHISVTLTPKEVYVRDGLHKTYEIQTGVHDSFDYSTDESAAVEIKVKDESNIRSFRYKLDDGPWQNVTDISGNQADIRIDLSQQLQDHYPGWHNIEVEAEDYFGNKAETTYTFMINPGPSATVSVAFMDGTAYASGDTANKPLLVTLQPELTVEAKYNRNAVQMRQAFYMITDSAEVPALQHSEWKEMGSSSMMVSREGNSYVHFKIVDEMGLMNIISTDKLNIDFNQNRY